MNSSIHHQNVLQPSHIGAVTAGQSVGHRAAIRSNYALLASACAAVLCMQIANASDDPSLDIQAVVGQHSQQVEDLSALVTLAGGPVIQVASSAGAAPVPVVSPLSSAIHGAVHGVAFPVVQKVHHVGLSISPSDQIETMMRSIATADLTLGGQLELPLAQTVLGGGLVSGLTHHVQAMMRPRDPMLSNRSNPVLSAVSDTVGLVEGVAGGVLDVTHIGYVADHALGGVGHLVAGAGSLTGRVVAGLTGSNALGSTVAGTTGQLAAGLDRIGDELESTNLAGVVGQTLGTVHGTTQALLQGVSGSVNGLAGGSSGLNGAVSGVGSLTGGLAVAGSSVVGSLTGNPASTPLPGVIPSAPPLGSIGGIGIGGISLPGGVSIPGITLPTLPGLSAAPTGLAPNDPRRVPAGGSGSGLVVGNGGLVGTVGSVLNQPLTSLFGGDGYVRNGSTAINSANIVQAYSVTNVLGLPVVNLSPAGAVLDGLGGVATGANSHLTVIGGATSDSYIFNINNGSPGGILGLALPDRAPGWADSCLNPLGLGLVGIDCWAVNAAQDYQVLIGDGAYANGSKEVVIGTNARHELTRMDANDVFQGSGLDHGTNPTGVPTADYDARLGHSVVIGDNASGTANAQTLLGAGATSDKANSVAIGFKSNADRGGMNGYTAFGITAAQNSIGEVAVGSAGRERQITHVAAGSGDTDAVNVLQLKQALTGVVGGADPYAVRYADDGNGAPDFTQVRLGNNNQATTVSGVANGLVNATSDQAINGSQLHRTASSMANIIGGNATVNANGQVTQVQFGHRAIAANGAVQISEYANISGVLSGMDSSIFNINSRVTGLATATERAVKYDLDDNGAIDYSTATLGGGNGTTRLTHLTDGNISFTSSDAITGRQLHGASTTLADIFGANAAVDANGQLLGPTFTLTKVAADGSTTSGSYDNVGSAFEAMDDSIVNINNTLNDIDVSVGGVEKRAMKYDVDANGDVDYSTATLGDSTTTTRLTNLTDGAVTAASSDAITGSQLHGATSALADVLGGNASVDANGNLVGPTFTLTKVAVDGSTTSGDYDNVGSAFEAVDDSIVNINNTLNDIDVSIGDIEKRAVKYDLDASGAIDYSTATLGDGNGTTRLTNLTDGSVMANSSDAVTGNQLHGTAGSIAQHLGGGAVIGANGQVTAPNYQFSVVDANGTLGNGSFNNVGSAFEAVGQSLSWIVNNGVGGGVDPLAVRYDTDAAGVRQDTITLKAASGNAAVGIANVADGQVTAGSRDAVTGNQLANTNKAVADVIGGGSSFDGQTATWIAPNFQLTLIGQDGKRTQSSFTDVGSAFDAVSRSLENISTQPPANAQPVAGATPYLQVNSSGAIAQASGNEAIALGSAASADGQGSIAIGQGASASAANSVALGAGATAERANTVSVGAAGNERQVTYVADGQQDTDAVNVRQLTASQQGSLRYDTNVDGSINYGSITMGQPAYSPTLIRNVAAGVEATDAVNVGQLQAGMNQAMDWSRQYTDDRFNSMSREMKDIDNRASAGVAAAMAMAGLPQPYEAGRSMAAVAASTFNGESSLAVGVSGVSEGGRWIYKASASANSRGDAGFTVGAGIQW